MYVTHTYVHSHTHTQSHTHTHTHTHAHTRAHTFMQSLLNALCPKDDTDIKKWRLEALDSGRHAYIGHEVTHMVDQDVARELRGIDIEPLTRNQLVELSQILGLPTTGTKQVVFNRLEPVITSINGE